MKTRVSNFTYPPSIARCQHIKVNGVQCGSPALKNRKLCHFHQRWQQGRIQLNANRSRRSRYSLDLPILEDANSIQVALMQGMRLLLTNQVEPKTAALLFYALQTASTNLRHTKFEPRPQTVVIDPRGVPNTSLGDGAWYKEEFEPEEETEERETEESETDERATEERQTCETNTEDSTLVNIQATVDIHAMAECAQPQRQKPDSKQCSCRSGEPLRHPGADAFPLNRRRHGFTAFPDRTRTSVLIRDGQRPR